MLTTFLGGLPDDITAALQRDPHSCDLWNAKGCADFANTLSNAAQEAFTRAIRLSDQYHHYIHYECAATFIASARWHLANEAWDAARVDLDAAIFQDHGSLSALLLRAWLSEREGKLEQAERDVAQAKRYNPKAADICIPSDWIGAPRYDRALATDFAWVQAIRLPEYPMAAASMTMHDKAFALLPAKPADAVALLVSQRSHPRAWRHYGMALAAAGRREGAREALDEAVRQHHAWHMAYHRAAATHRLNRALAYHTQGQDVLAWQDASKAADIDKGWNLAKEWRDKLAQKACA